MEQVLFHQNTLYVYNTTSRQKERFEPLHAPFVGMYACGPTVYSEPHLGNCRSFVMYDLMFRYMLHLGYKVRYVRNITDAGHVESTSGETGDRISKQAKIEQVEPMEIVQKYSVKFHRIMDTLNCLPPSIEPTATGHIVEQIEMTKKIMENGFAYETDDAIYFDVEKFSANYPYTKLSGRNLDDLLNNTRELGGQESKKGRLDFALMIKAKPEHIMRWPSPWGDVYPGWHIECSAMSEKYLGKTFDIHCGGMDLIPTHHTNEIAQCVACNHVDPVKYWLHPNMLTVNGQKMSKSLGNSFLPAELFDGSHPLLDQGYSPMTVRFSMLQAHYRSTLDFSNDALKAAEKGYKRLMNAKSALDQITISGIVNNDEEANVNKLLLATYDAMNNDFNSAQAIAELNEAASMINTWNSLQNKKANIQEHTLLRLKTLLHHFLFDIFGLLEESENNNEKLNGVMELVIDIRKDARGKKDFATSDKIRDALQGVGIQLKDSKDGTSWQAE
ncbi:MAG: cysteine--tRNA ligase [Bacteroidetes bacterium]|jgi:cysteinyl-tRNA synthetase|nr:cysteine--tRNA ligase [Bacteroidota bacterium]